jgi:hypothetical protein
MRDGLGFGELAASCVFRGAGAPVVEDLLACVLERAQCLGENAVARAIPRAYEVLSELDLDPDEMLPCVEDPDELNFGSPSGAFLDAELTR